MHTRITSRQHALVQRCRGVAERREETAVLLDGEHLVAEALAARVPLAALLTDSPSHPVVRDAEIAGVRGYEGTPAVLDAASPARSASRIVAIADWTPQAPGALFHDRTSLLVALLGVQDPGNVGGIIRTADALGADGVLTLEGSADPRGWKALRGSMGSAFRLPVAQSRLDLALADARAHGLRIVATVPTGGIPLETADFHVPTLLLLGSEGVGLDSATIARADVSVTIPMRPGVSSLNVGVTAAVILWETYRRRAAADERVP